MSTVLYQGFKSRLESQLMDQSTTLNLKLVSPNNTVVQIGFNSSIVPADHSKIIDIPLTPPNVHYPSWWWLSDKSLSVCTENLGSETGSEFVESSIFLKQRQSTSSTTKENSNDNYESRVTKEQQRQSRNRRNIPEAKKKQLPPPLTTLSGPECLDIRAQREDGRLILKALRTTKPARRSCFLVDRSNGRLSLSLADSMLMKTTCSSKEELLKEVTITNDKQLVTEAACSGRSLIMEMEQNTRVGSSCCWCNENHKNINTNKNIKKKGLMTTSMMVKLEPRFLVASS